jgi:hypothetical protein
MTHKKQTVAAQGAEDGFLPLRLVVADSITGRRVFRQCLRMLALLASTGFAHSQRPSGHHGCRLFDQTVSGRRPTPSFF